MSAERGGIYETSSGLVNHLVESKLKSGIFQTSITTQADADRFIGELGILLSKNVSKKYKIGLSTELVTEEIGGKGVFFVTVKIVHESLFSDRQ